MFDTRRRKQEFYGTIFCIPCIIGHALLQREEDDNIMCLAGSEEQKLVVFRICSAPSSSVVLRHYRCVIAYVRTSDQR